MQVISLFLFTCLFPFFVTAELALYSKEHFIGG